MEIEPFLVYLKNVKRYSPLTLQAYEEDLSQFSEFCEKVEFIHDWSEVTSGMVRRFEVGLMSGKLAFSKEGRVYRPKAMAPKSVRRKLSSLRTFFRYQMREGLLQEDPTEVVVAPKIGKRLPVFVPDYKMDDLLGEKESGKGDFSTFRDLMLLMVAYYTGMRRSELVSLKLDDLDLSAGVVRVTGKGDKQRIVPLLEDLQEEMLEYLEEREKNMAGKRHGFFFITDAGSPVNEKYVYRHVKKCLGEVTSLAKRSPHILRHSFATALLNNGACIEAIRELLGHSSLAATQVYTHNSFESLKRVYNEAHPRA
ncbi:MAG: tyrosine-type recombinase/integrase [Oscillibacter sp.]|nr:tyrosine-type recombinase/integrase [Oscillibacter sp.]